jgi:hypothetical protein
MKTGTLVARFDLFRSFTKRSMISAVATSLVIVFTFSGWTLEIPTPASSPADSLKSHARYLASPELGGRALDSPGIKLARDYIAKEFARYGLTPGGDNGTYFQGFDVATGLAVKEPTWLTLGGAPLKVETDWIPLGLSASGQAETEVVFAGYGITAKNYGYDDYAGVDVKGKIALVLR